MDSKEKKTERKPNRYEAANFLSIVTFTWILPVFWRGYRQELRAEDLPRPLNTHESDRLGAVLEREWEKEKARAKKKKQEPSLLRVMRIVFGPRLYLLGVVIFIYELILRILQPLFLGMYIRYFSQAKDGPITREMAYLYGCGIVACSGITFLLLHPTTVELMHTGMKMRVALCSLIYRHSLTLDKGALTKTTPGQVVNLISNDVGRFDLCVLFLHVLWVGPLQTVLVTYLIWSEIGLSCLFGLAALLVVIPFQGWLGKKSSSLRMKTAMRTDERVRLMNEIISGIQVIKMYAWERPFALLVEHARRKEINFITKSLQIKGIYLSFIVFHARTTIFIAVLAYVLLGNSISAEKVFVLTSLYGILRQNMTMFFPTAITYAAEALVSVKRIKTFLTIEPSEGINLTSNIKMAAQNGSWKSLVGDEKGQDQKEGAKEPGVSLRGVTAKWTESAQDNTLTGISIEAVPSQLTVIIGSVGSGKTSLLHVVLKELPTLEGSVETRGRLSYTSQEPWLFHGTVRQNILFGSDYDASRYKAVLKACCLLPDLEQFSYGDRTIVGERGVSLSGGQRARINLARAVYKEAEIYLLDDPLSAVDPHVAKHLFDDCIQGFLRKKTVILVTHQLQFLDRIPQIVLLDSGNAVFIGNYEDFQKTGHEFSTSMGKKEIKEEEVSKVVKEEEEVPKPELLRSRSRQMSIRSSTSFYMDDNLTPLEAPEERGESRATGSVSGKVYAAYLTSSGFCTSFFVFTLFLLSQGLASCSDYWLSYWVNVEEHVLQPQVLVNASSNGTTSDRPEASFLFVLSRQNCIYVFTGLTLSTIFFALLRSYCFFNQCMRTSITLHNTMFNSITRATMWFFNHTTSGQVLNRFSKDMGSVDELLPQTLIDVIQISLTCLSIVVVVLSVNPYLLVPTLIAAVIFYFLRLFYIETARSVKRLESITRSPVYAHFNATLQGSTTIKAFQAQKILTREFDNHQNLHSSAWFLFLYASKAFAFWLDMVCWFFIATVTLSFLVLGGDNFGGSVGLAISQAIGLTGMFQWGMRQTAELENQMTSVERILEYTDLESEKNLDTPKDKEPRKTWPEFGKIEFQDVILRYSSDEPPVLKGLSFTILPEQKVGIVGRTGAGKSSLIQALFRLADLEGKIWIDGVETGSLSLSQLRAKISIIPQEPVLFSATLRKNLDPFDQYADHLLWAALEEVELKETATEMGGLQAVISEGGANLSVGQRQLVCLARAILANNRILVLDEATASVDPQTDAFIQETIRKKFAKCTVLTIAHRLNTIMDSDKILVMDSGTLAEFDHPHILLSDSRTIFSSMVLQTGVASAEMLRSIAEENYHRRHQKHSNMNVT